MVSPWNSEGVTRVWSNRAGINPATAGSMQPFEAMLGARAL